MKTITLSLYQQLLKLEQPKRNLAVATVVVAYLLAFWFYGVVFTVLVTGVGLWIYWLVETKETRIRNLKTRKMRKQLGKAFIAAGISRKRQTGDGKTEDLPPIIKINPQIASWEVTVRIPDSNSPSNIENSIETVASTMCLRYSVSRKSTTVPGFYSFRLLHANNPLDQLHYPSSPFSGKFTNPCHFGVDETGTEVAVSLYAQTLLIGGSIGSGKSVGAWNSLLHAAHDPDTVLIICDLKPEGLETYMLQQRANIYVTNVTQFLEVVTRIYDTMFTRNKALKELGLQKANAGLGSVGAPIVLFVDEAAQLTSSGDDGYAALEILEKIVEMGRASGFTIILATQKPTGDSIPTKLRDIMGYRLCFRTGSSEQSKSILGSSQILGLEPHLIPVENPGLCISNFKGFLEPFKSYNLDIEMIKENCDYLNRTISREHIDRQTDACLAPARIRQTSDEEAPPKRRRRR